MTTPTGVPATSSRSSGRFAFVFDIVIVYIKLAKFEDADINKIRVDAKFNSNELKITSSRINVDEFHPRRGFEFAERPSVLKDQLEKNLFECTVYYDSKAIGIHTYIVFSIFILLWLTKLQFFFIYLGTSSFAWPESFTGCLIGNCGRELLHCTEVEIKTERESVGKMQLFARLQIKCQEFSYVLWNSLLSF